MNGFQIDAANDALKADAEQREEIQRLNAHINRQDVEISQLKANFRGLGNVVQSKNAEIEQLRAERAGDQQRLFHYEGEMKLLRENTAALSRLILHWEHQNGLLEGENDRLKALVETCRPYVPTTVLPLGKDATAGKSPLLDGRGFAPAQIDAAARKIAYHFGYTWGSSGLEHELLRDIACTVLAAARDAKPEVSDNSPGPIPLRVGIGRDGRRWPCFNPSCVECRLSACQEAGKCGHEQAEWTFVR